MIELNNITKIYGKDEGKVIALKDISLKIPNGKFIAVVGSSGCGKSTLLNMIGALDEVTSGEICVKGMSLRNLNHNELAEYRNKNIGFVFQSFYLEPSFTVLENVEMPLVIAGIDKKEYKERAIAIINQLGLEDKTNKKVNTLSGGQKQRTSIARALINSPSIILADEPTGNLDSKNGKEIINILREIANQGRTVLLVTHNMQEAKEADCIIELNDGKIVNITNDKVLGNEDK